MEIAKFKGVKTLEPVNKKFGMCKYVGNDYACRKTSVFAGLTNFDALTVTRCTARRSRLAELQC